MPKDFSNKNLQKTSFRDEDLVNASFTDSDLRGADFTGSNLSGADFTNVRTGITPANTVLIFIGALLLSLLGGYISMLVGNTIHTMLRSTDPKIRTGGILTGCMMMFFIFYYYWQGGGKAIKNFIIPVFLFAAIVAVLAKLSGLGTGMGMLYLILSFVLLIIMFIIGTIARAIAGSMSYVLFIIVALSGGLFAKSVGGGVGTLIMAISCAMVSKRALTGVKGFSALRRITFSVTSRMGTSFRSSRLDNANFSKAIIQNSDFTNTDVSKVNWRDSKIANCILSREQYIIKHG